MTEKQEVPVGVSLGSRHDGNDGMSRGSRRVRAWIEAMRLRTLPVGASCVVAGVALALVSGSWRPAPAVICLVFALLAQIASNFANEYFDYRAGVDAPGRVGPRRGVTEGDIPPGSMLTATLGTLILACSVGCLLIVWGGWWLVGAGVVIALFAMAYSAGPYPLSRHGWGSAAVMIFFGIVPVTLTYYLQTGEFSRGSLLTGVGVGALACNILLVNNYRDRHEDAAVGKRTDVHLMGERVARLLYLFNGLLAVGLTLPLWVLPGWWGLVFPGIYVIMLSVLWRSLYNREGSALNRVLGLTAMSELYFGVALMAIGVIMYLHQ